MLTVRGYYENGKVHLPAEMAAQENGPVLVTFLDSREMTDQPSIAQFLESRQKRLDSQILPRRLDQDEEQKHQAPNRDSNRFVTGG